MGRRIRMPMTKRRHRLQSLQRPALLLSIALCGLACSRSGLGSSENEIDYCFTVRPGERIDGEVGAEISIGRADLHFLVDNSRSMENEIEHIADGLKTIVVPGVRAIIPDAEFGLSLVADFGPRANEHAYQLLQTITDDVDAVSTKASQITLESAGDPPEAQLEGLYQVATGQGLTPSIPRAPACADGRVGGVCFRADATHLVLLFTDAEMRGALLSNSPSGPIYREPSDRMWGIVPYTRVYSETAEALNALNIFVVGLWSGPPGHEGRVDMERIVEATGALDDRNQPIVLDIGQDGQTLNVDVVNAIEQLVAGARPDVFLTLKARGGEPPDGLIRNVRAASVEPAGWARPSADGRYFEGVRPNAFVTFSLTFDGTVLRPQTRRRQYLFEARFQDRGGARLGTATVSVVVPAVGSDDGC